MRNPRVARLTLPVIVCAVLALVTVGSVAAQEPPTWSGTTGLMSAQASPGPVNVWVTTGDRSRLLEPQPSLQFGADQGDGLVIDVNEQHRFQEMDGFGAAMTDSSAWLIDNAMTASQRDQLMRRLFSASEGIGMSYVRVPIGSSDHALSHYIPRRTPVTPSASRRSGRVPGRRRFA